MICLEFKTVGGDFLGDTTTILCGADVALYRRMKRHARLCAVMCGAATSRYTVSP